MINYYCVIQSKKNILLLLFYLKWWKSQMVDTVILFHCIFTIVILTRLTTCKSFWLRHIINMIKSILEIYEFSRNINSILENSIKNERSWWWRWGLFGENFFSPDLLWLHKDLLMSIAPLILKNLYSSSELILELTHYALINRLYLQVRHLELKKEKEVERSNLVRFLLDAMAIQFKNPSIWN